MLFIVTKIFSICILKPPSNMDKMRADMGGAANVVSTILTLASLKEKVNVIGKN